MAPHYEEHAYSFHPIDVNQSVAHYVLRYDYYFNSNISVHYTTSAKVQKHNNFRKTFEIKKGWFILIRNDTWDEDVGELAQPYLFTNFIPKRWWFTSVSDTKEALTGTFCV